MSTNPARRRHGERHHQIEIGYTTEAQQGHHQPVLEHTGHHQSTTNAQLHNTDAPLAHTSTRNKHHDYKTNTPVMRHRVTTSTSLLHYQSTTQDHECATNAPLLRHESTTNTQTKTRLPHHLCTTRAPVAHHEHTTDTPPIHHYYTTITTPLHHEYTTNPYTTIPPPLIHNSVYHCAPRMRHECATMRHYYATQVPLTHTPCTTMHNK